MGDVWTGGEYSDLVTTETLTKSKLVDRAQVGVQPAGFVFK